MGNNQSYQNSYKEYEAAFSYSDLLLELQTLSDIRRGWKFILNPKDKNQMAEKLSHQPTYILGFLGRENNLKANLINKLCGYPNIKTNIQELDQFRGIKTRFSQVKVLNDIKQEKDKILKPHHKILTCISSTNTDYPVFFHKDEEIFKFFSKFHEIGHVLSDGRSVNKLDNKKYEHLKSLMMDDKFTTESFIENYIMEISNIIIIVINEINFDDQKFIEKVCSGFKIKKKILVIHYFEKPLNLFQMKLCIDKEIKGAFLVKEHQNDLKKFYPNITDKKGEKLNRMMYVGESINEPSSLLNPDDRNCVIHLIYAKEGTKMGRYFNNTTIEYIKYLLKKNFAEFKEFKVTESMQNFITNNYLNYFQINKKNEKDLLKIDVVEELTVHNKFLKASINYDIKYLSDPKYDVLGNIVNVNTSDFTPPYHTLERKNFFEIIAEIPLLRKESLKVTMDRSDTNFQYLLISGEKKNNADELKEINGQILEMRGNLEWGNFNLKIPVAPYSVRFKKKKEIEYKEGLVIVKMYKGEDNEHQMLTEEKEENTLDSNIKKMDELKISGINFEEK